LGSQSLVAGALSLVDKNAAQSYIENSVGQEAGQFIGQTLAQPVQGYFDNLTQRIEQKQAASQPAATTSAQDAANATAQAQSTAIGGQTTADQAEGVVKDQLGNPAAPIQTPVAADNTSAPGTDNTGSVPTSGPGSVTQPFTLNPQAPVPATADQFATDVQQVASDKAQAEGGTEAGSAEHGGESGEHGGENEAAKAIIEENPGTIETNKVFVDSNGRLRNAKGQFAASPFSDEQLEESQKENLFTKESAFEAKYEIFKSSANIPLVTPLNFDVLGFQGQVGLNLESLTLAQAQLTLNNNGLSGSLSETAKAGLVYSQGGISGQYGEANYQIASTAQEQAGVNATVNNKGVDLNASAGFLAAAFQASGKVQTAKVDIPGTFGIFQAQAEVEGQFNAGAIGLQGGIGFQVNSSGLRFTEQAGATPVVGGSEKVTVQISINTQAAVQVYQQAAATASTIYNNTVSAVQSVQNYWQNVYNKLTH
jgi:hypothetical protein